MSRGDKISVMSCDEGPVCDEVLLSGKQGN